MTKSTGGNNVDPRLIAQVAAVLLSRGEDLTNEGCFYRDYERSVRSPYRARRLAFFADLARELIASSVEAAPPAPVPMRPEPVWSLARLWDKR